MRVLLADDSYLILERLKEMISIHSDVEIIGSYRDGFEALTEIRNLKPDLAIVDIKMPGINGLEVLSQIRKENIKVKFIILTFSSSIYYRQLAIQSGADYFFSKSEDFDKVLLVVKEMLLKESLGSNSHMSDIVCFS